jgi:DHA1 family multidrug resistance protein-like MFS transporter
VPIAIIARVEASADSPVESMRGARRQQVIMLIGFGLGSLAWNFCWPFLPLRVQAVGIAELGAVAQFTGLLAGAANLITAAIGPLWILLGERFGYKYQVMRAHAGTAVSMSLIGFARTPLEIGGAAAVLGIFGGNYPHYLALAASRAAPSEVGQVIGDLQAAGQVGSTIGPVVGGLIVARLGLPAAFVATSVVSFVAFLIATTGLRTDKPGVSAPRKARVSLRESLADPDNRWLMLLFPIADAFVQGLRPLIPVAISLRVSDPAAVATATGITATMAMAGTVVSALLVGRLSRRIAPRWILVSSLPLAGLFAALLPEATGVPTLLAGWALFGLASGATTPAIFAWMGRLSSGSSGAYALLATVNMLDFAIGPAVMGQASVYSLALPFYLAAASTLVAAVVVVFTGPRDAKKRVVSAPTIT